VVKETECYLCKNGAYYKPIEIVHESSSKKKPIKALKIHLCIEHLHELLTICIGYSDFEERSRLVELIRGKRG
jgi:hypothetical protein